MGSFIHHLYSASNSFQEMIVLKSNEKCIMELSRWLHDRTGAYDWTHTSVAAAELEGNRDQLQEKESCRKSSIKQILKCDFEQENITSPVELPLADCVLCVFILEAISKNEDEFMRNLEKILKLLKPGGHLLLISVIDVTYFITGGERLHMFTHDENFVKNALSKLGLVIDYCAVQRRRNVSDLTDYKAGMFIAAHTRDQFHEKESHLKSSIKQILKCDFEQTNITSPVELPLADCVFCVWILEVINTTYVITGGERFHMFTHDESFVKNALGKLGLVIDYYAVQRRRNVSNLIDYRAVMFTVAHKVE
ncbi:nicotinamide N-methyltransferase-like [Mantella aurantiaca]